MSVYYNEFDPKAAQWLRELMSAGLIPTGTIDTRSIEDVRPLDVIGYTQCHFFAGIGGWPLALALAGIPETARLWTGSCPCQPFSTAGRGKGFADERHLWPAFRWLIEQCDPPVVFGEQVSSPAGRSWLDVVLTELERSGYACAASDLCAAGVGAPHIRQRLYWVAKSSGERRQGIGLHLCERGPLATVAEAGRGREDRDGVEYASGTGGRWDSRTISREEARTRLRALADLTQPAGTDSYVAHAQRDATEPGRAAGESGQGARAQGAGSPAESGRRGMSGVVAHADGAGSQGRLVRGHGADQRAAGAPSLDSAWTNIDWVRCNDPNGERWRPIESGTQPLAHGIPERVGLLRGYGNAIVPQVAALFIKAALA